jgi:hypothetical protein
MLVRFLLLIVGLPFVSEQPFEPLYLGSEDQNKRSFVNSIENLSDNHIEVVPRFTGPNQARDLRKACSFKLSLSFYWRRVVVAGGTWRTNHLDTLSG